MIGCGELVILADTLIGFKSLFGGVGGKRVFFKRSVHGCNLTDGVNYLGLSTWKTLICVCGVLDVVDV